MKKMAAGAFKVHCLAVMDEVQANRETVVITRHGKPVAKLIPVEKDAGDIYNFLAGKGAITGDVVAPVIAGEDWGKLRGFLSIRMLSSGWRLTKLASPRMQERASTMR